MNSLVKVVPNLKKFNDYIFDIKKGTNPMMLSGLIYPISSMPAIFQYLTAILPPRYFIVFMQSEFMAGTIWKIVVLSLFSGGFYFLILFYNFFCFFRFLSFFIYRVSNLSFCGYYACGFNGGIPFRFPWNDSSFCKQSSWFICRRLFERAFVAWFRYVFFQICFSFIISYFPLACFFKNAAHILSIFRKSTQRSLRRC